MLSGLTHSWPAVGKQCKERKREMAESGGEGGGDGGSGGVKQQVTQGSWRKRPLQQSRRLSVFSSLNELLV